MGWLQARTSLLLEKAAERARQAKILDTIAGGLFMRIFI